MVAGVMTIINFVIFEPGTPVPFFPAFDPALGYPAFAVLNDPLAPLLISPITDFCSPLATINTVFAETLDDPDVPGSQAGFALRTNPPADGTYVATSFVRSLWDADDDGIESNLDPCHYEPDTVWDPRAQNPAGDADKDGLPATCDPDDGKFDMDYDDDGFLNRHDLCPFDYDWAQDSDTDDVGDACDRVIDDPTDGGLSHRHTICTRSFITIGAGGAPGTEPPCPEGPDLPALVVTPPPTSIRRAGDVMSIGVFVQGKPGYGYGSGLAATNVNFVVEGANPASGSCLTDNSGSCEFNYLGANLGMDTVTVTVPTFGLEATTTVDWKEPPANDDFADAVPVSSVPFLVAISPALASDEPAEPNDCSAATGTVWYTFTPTVDMLLEAAIGAEEMYLGYVGVWAGETLAEIDAVRCGTPHFPPDELRDISAFFLAEAGVVYHFSVSAFPFYLQDWSEFEIDFSLTQVQGVVGDLNCDGEVGPPDSLFALKLDAGVFVPECAAAFGDTNCDGEVNALDSLRILMFDAGKPLAVIEACPAVAWSSA
jgi:hypothetical protein